MIWLLFPQLMRSFFMIPCAIVASLAAIAAICGCVHCMHCRLRDCFCIKRCLRLSGHDRFDDFELMILVHEALFERKEAKLTTVVRVTAGPHSVQTDPNSNGIFQQPLHIVVEQGTTNIVVDLLDGYDRVLATLQLDTAEQILNPKALEPEKVYNMKQKGKGLRAPKVKLTMVVSTSSDMEQGLLSGVSSDVDILVRQQLQKAKQEGKAPHGEGLSEMEVLKQACAGPLELFEGLGNTTCIYVAVLGPPTSRRWVLGIWSDKHDYDAKKYAIQEVDLLKIQSVQADPTRHHVFVINYYDESRVRQTLTFRRMDRARDVWVEILHLLVQKAHESRKALKRDKTLHGERMGRFGRSGEASRSRPGKTTR